MLMECAILYGKLGNHFKAFDILVNRLRNLDAAERYCTEFARNMVCDRERLIICIGGGQGKDYSMIGMNGQCRKALLILAVPVSHAAPPTGPRGTLQALSGLALCISHIWRPLLHPQRH